MVLVLDYPEGMTHKMMEEILHLLTKEEEIPSKIICSTLFSLITLDLEQEAQGVSGKRKRQVNSKTNPNVSSQKRMKFSCSKAKQANVEDIQLIIEDVMKDINLKLKQGKMEDE